MENLQVAKRKRLIAGAERKPLVRSEDFWFEDGNVVLQTDSTEFKVHRSVLSKNSDYFYGFLELDGADGAQNLSATLVLPHSGRDVHELLHALYNGSRLLSHWRENDSRLSFATISALIRLGNKYQFTELRDEAATCLYGEFPSKLTDWVSSSRASFQLIQTDGMDDVIVLFDLLMLAIECKMLTIQVSIYLDIFNSATLSDIKRGLQGKEGATHKLPAEVQVICLSGFEELRKEMRETTYGWLTELPSSTCTNMNEDKDGDKAIINCREAARSLYMSLFGPSSACHGLEDWEESWGEGLCSQCEEAARSHHLNGRQYLWDRLPSFFELQRWEHLTNFL